VISTGNVQVHPPRRRFGSSRLQGNEKCPYFANNYTYTKMNQAEAAAAPKKVDCAKVYDFSVSENLYPNISVLNFLLTENQNLITHALEFGQEMLQ
jgi:hypothetical protein